MNPEFISYNRKRQHKINDICAKMRAGKERKRIESEYVREPKMITLNNLSTIFKMLKVEPVTEYVFCPGRKWRFDYAFPSRMIAVEYEGIFSARSRHLSIKGFDGDCEKYSKAAILGWKVIRVTAIMIKDGRALNLITEALQGQRGNY